LRWVGGGWREYAQGGAGAGTRPADGGKMTEREAYQILGLQPGRAQRTSIARTAPSLRNYTPTQAALRISRSA
jgi:hypothetical protein